MPSVFISYSSKDREIADYIASAVKAQGIDCFIDYERLKPGQPFPDQLRDQIKSRDCVIFIVSANSIISKWVRAEINLAHGEDKKILPVILEKVDRFEDEFWFISSIHRIDFTSWSTHKNIDLPLRNLLAAILNENEPTLIPIIKRNSGLIRKRLWLLIPLIALLLVALSLIASRFSPPPKVSLAYSFLLDTSDAMNQLLNGIPRSEMAAQAIDKIVNFTGFDVKDTWRVLRRAGGDDCDDTEKVIEGSSAAVPPNIFMSHLNSIKPAGINAYQKGINESLNDFINPDSPALSSDVKVSFIFFAALDPRPCSPYQQDLIDALRIYKIKGIKTGLCLFGLGVDLPGFQEVKDAAAAEGIDTKCFYNFQEDNAEDIAKIAIGVIQRQIGLATNEEEITPIIPAATLPNINTPTTLEAIFTSLPPTFTPIPTFAPNQPIEARGGPGLFYPVVATIPAGEQLNFVGISEDKTWAQVKLIDGSMVWVSIAGYGNNILNILNNLPIILGPTNTPTTTNTPTNTSTPTTIPSCPNALLSRLYPGVVGYVLGGDPLPLNVRDTASISGQKLAQIPVNGRFSVLEGPSCHDNMAWFRVRLDNGVQEGWILEGDETSYFVSPVEEEIPSSSLTRTQIQSNNNRILTVCQPLIEDEFILGKSSNDWFQDTTAGARSNEQIINDFYEIRLNEIPATTDEATSWGSLRGFTFRDGRLEAVIKASRFSQIVSRVGIWFRYQDERNFLAFMIRNNGSYYVGRYENNTYQDIVKWTQTSTINTGDNAVNTLRVDIVGNEFTLYINGVLLTKFTDSTWPDGRFTFFGASQVTPNTFGLDYFRVCAIQTLTPTISSNITSNQSELETAATQTISQTTTTPSRQITIPPIMTEPVNQTATQNIIGQ